MKWQSVIDTAFGACLVLFIIDGCSDVKATSRLVQCAPKQSEIVWQKDTMCGVDVKGHEMVLKGFFSDAQGMHVACVAISQTCEFTE